MTLLGEEITCNYRYQSEKEKKNNNVKLVYQM